MRATERAFEQEAATDRETVERRVAALTSERGVTWQVSPDLMNVLGPDGIFESFNPAWQAMLGLSSDELASTPFFELLHPDDVPRSRETFEAAMVRGQPALRFENRYREQSGRYRWISWIAVPEG